MSSAQQAHRTKTEIAVESLRQRIREGELVASRRYTYAELIAMLGMSATPIREAIRQLEAEGFIIARPHRGIQIADLTVLTEARAQDVYAIRSALESGAARLAAAKLDDRQIQNLAAIHKRMCGEGRPLSKLREENEQLHFAIYEAAGSEGLLRLIRTHWEQLPWDAVWGVPGRREVSIQQHAEILEALQRKDGSAAASLMSEHIFSGLDLVLERMKGSEP